MLQLWAQRGAYSPLSRETATHQNAESCPAEVGHLSLRGSGLQGAVLWVGAEGLVSLSSLFMSVSVIYCCIIKHPRSQRFEEQFIIVPHSPVVTGLSWQFLLGGSLMQLQAESVSRLRWAPKWFLHSPVCSPPEMAETIRTGWPSFSLHIVFPHGQLGLPHIRQSQSSPVSWTAYPGAVFQKLR